MGLFDVICSWISMSNLLACCGVGGRVCGLVLFRRFRLLQGVGLVAVGLLPASLLSGLIFWGIIHSLFTHSVTIPKKSQFTTFTTH